MEGCGCRWTGVGTVEGIACGPEGPTLLTGSKFCPTLCLTARTASTLTCIVARGQPDCKSWLRSAHVHDLLLRNDITCCYYISMISDKVERQRVYLTYRKLFTGKNARVRKKKAILRIVQSSPTSEPLDEQHLKQKTIPILRSLLNDRVFEIEEAAKIDFPEVWTTSREENKLDETSIRATGASQAPAELNEAASNPNVASTPRGMLLIL